MDLMLLEQLFKFQNNKLSNYFLRLILVKMVLLITLNF